MSTFEEMKPYNYMIKPVSGSCSMNCRYCFYKESDSQSSAGKPAVMDDETTRKLIIDAMSVTDVPFVTFSFQGGEPTAAGLDYFRSFVKLVKENNKNFIKVHYAIQTNGLGIDEEWADFFHDNHFVVGVSIDGNKDLHDRLRLDETGKGTWNRASKAVALLIRKKVDVSLLCVVSRMAAKNPVKLYNGMKKLGPKYFQFIPCLDPLEAERGSTASSLTPEAYGDFLCTLFDTWYRDWETGTYPSIRLFDDYVHMAMGFPGGTCATSGSCGAYLVVEADGTVYPCDYYCTDQWKLGMIQEKTASELANCNRESAFLATSVAHPEECEKCRWRLLCNGGCKRDWYLDENGAKHNYFCLAFKQLFKHAEDRFTTIAEAEFRQIRKDGGF